MSDWQPIETAPRDGTPVWGISMEAQSPTGRVTWLTDGDRWVRVAAPQKFAGSGPSRWWPTHWQPLIPPSV